MRRRVIWQTLSVHVRLAATHEFLLRTASRRNKCLRVLQARNYFYNQEM